MVPLMGRSRRATVTGWGATAVEVTAAASALPVSPWSTSRLSTVVAADLAAAFDASDLAPITRAEALSVPAVARGRTIVCAGIARLPLRTSPADWEPDTRFLDQPEPDRPRFSTLRDTLDDLLFLGSAVWRVLDRYATGRVRSAEYLPRAAMTRDLDGYWRHVEEPDPIDPRDLLWFDGPHDGILATGGRALRAAARLDRAAATAAANPVPAVELHQITDDPLTDDEIRDLCRSWDAALRDSSTAYTSRAVELRTHGAHPEQLLIQGRNLAAVEVARLIGLPAPVLDAVTPGMSGTYQSMSERSRSLVDDGLGAYMAPITARLSMSDIVPRPVAVSFDTFGLIRPALPDRVAAYRDAIESGILTPAECRSLELTGGIA